MVKMTYLISTDLDNTLLTPEKTISSYTQNLMRKLIENGHYFVYNTGRPYHGTIDYLQMLPCTMPSIFLNGALIVWVDPKTLDAKKIVTFPLNTHLLQDLLNEIIPYLDAGLIYGFRNMYVYHKRKMPEWLLHTNSYITIKRLSSKTKFTEEPLSGSLQIKEDAIEDFLKVIQKEKYQEFFFYSWGHFDHIYSFEILKKGVNKGMALRYVKDQLGISPITTIAFGDNFNDVSMIEAADEGVYMCNSKEELLKKGKHYTSLTSSQDGVFAYLTKYHPELF